MKIDRTEQRRSQRLCRFLRSCQGGGLVVSLGKKGGGIMRLVCPDYYKDFKCIAGACRHSCCIGWEIDIDPETLSYYDGVTGLMGQRLRQSIARTPEPHFILGPGERCPFLNRDGLCDIILELGEEHIGGICADHPRFRNELPGRTEIGLGLCCEEAARLILGRKEPMRLAGAPAQEEDAFLLLRDAVLGLLQDRSRSIPARMEDMLALCGAVPPAEDMSRWAETLLGLERLDEAWTARLEELEKDWAQLDIAGFDRHMARRQTEYEQLLVYLVYRHMANAADEQDLAARAAFAALGYELLHALGALQWTRSGAFGFGDQVELARLFSSEIEYSDENLDILLDALC